MLHEVARVKQRPGEPKRRWFCDDRMDLIVWQQGSGLIEAFQLCYDRPYRERAVSWYADIGFLHSCVDDGERAGRLQKMSPIFMTCPKLADVSVITTFKKRSTQIDPIVARFVATKLNQFHNGIVEAVPASVDNC